MKEKKSKILLLEDEEAHVYMIKRAFARISPEFELFLVNNLHDARQALADHLDFVAVIFDLRLPDGRGTDLLTDIADYEAPAIAMTSYGDENEAVKALKEGAMDYVAKSKYAFKDMPHIVGRAIREFKQIQENKRVNAELHKLHQAVEQSSTAIVITDGEGVIDYANQRMSEMTGYSNDELMGNNVGMLVIKEAPIPIDDDEVGLWETVYSGKTWRGLFYCQRKDGTYYWDQSVISPIRDEKGNIVQFISYKEDVTASMQAQEELKKMEEQLRLSQKMQTIGTLAGGIAHDFNNILTPIFGFGHMILSSAEPDSQVHSDASHIIKSAERARDLVKQILAFARKGEQKREVLKLSSIVDDSVKMLKAMLPSSITIDVQFCHECPHIIGDATQLHQVLMNLATNSYQAIGNKAGHISIKTDTVVLDENYCRLHSQNLKAGTYVMLQVKDDGPGISEVVLERIFEPFYTTKSVGEGTGLGLSVVHGIMVAHEGDVLVESSSEGTIFKLYFPAQNHELSMPSPKNKILKGQGQVIYVVDDEVSNLKMQSRLLRYLGYKVITFKDGIKAMEAFKKNPQGVDLLITDQTMPYITGMELMVEILKIRPDFPLILLSGYIVEELSQDLLKSNSVAFLNKPVDLPELSTTIFNLLQKKDPLL